MTDTAWPHLPWIILSTSSHCPVRGSNSRISSEPSVPPKYLKANCFSQTIQLIFIFISKEYCKLKYLIILQVTCHQDLVVNVGPTETRARRWKTASVDPGWWTLHQQLSGGEVAIVIATRDKVSLKYYYSTIVININTYLGSLIIVVGAAAMVISPLLQPR